ncbi:dynein light chain LC8-type [Fusarium oxysporum NRRL 32931]|uniref:Dynein light chain n=9 Tax=Fusarium oxysporum species complex TaxID=171631 RepID=W9IJW6_FUSOX|nr:dynein light chain LC8-type [Fusarium oxysporum NRRL 32931]
MTTTQTNKISQVALFPKPNTFFNLNLTQDGRRSRSQGRVSRRSGEARGSDQVRRHDGGYATGVYRSWYGESMTVLRRRQEDEADVTIAQEAMAKFTIEKDIAQHIKRTFDERKGPTWHCIVGRNFGSFVTHGSSNPTRRFPTP